MQRIRRAYGSTRALWELKSNKNYCNVPKGGVLNGPRVYTYPLLKSNSFPAAKYSHMYYNKELRSISDRLVASDRILLCILDLFPELLTLLRVVGEHMIENQRFRVISQPLE